MIRQTVFDRLRWWATLLEGRSIADRQHGWSGLWLSSEDATALVRLMREAAEQGERRQHSGSHGPCGDGDDDWPDTQPASFDAPADHASSATALGTGYRHQIPPRDATVLVEAPRGGPVRVSRRLFNPLRLR